MPNRSAIRRTWSVRSASLCSGPNEAKRRRPDKLIRKLNVDAGMVIAGIVETIDDLLHLAPWVFAVPIFVVRYAVKLYVFLDDSASL